MKSTPLLLIILLTGWSTSVSKASDAAAEGDTLRVSIKQGDIETSKTVGKDGKHYYVFKGIPFAKPPTGDLRFKNPEPADSWSGVRDGSLEGDQCPQQDLTAFLQGETKSIGNEDCLFLNVYTPGPHASNLPVMVWIHGGGFTMGSAKEYDPRPLMTKDVVVVVIQYRLGTLAYLTTEDSVMPGNVGLKDQVMALKWVQENIQAFGGDHNRVTVFGESAGGISAHFLVLSPMAKGLFHRAIAQSGTALVPGMLGNNNKEVAAQVGQMVECKNIDPEAFDSAALYNCLKDVPLDALILVHLRFAKFGFNPNPILPSVDGEFFPEHPIKILKEGKYNKVDFMTGICRDEGGFITRMFLPNPELMNGLEQNFSTNAQYMVFVDTQELVSDYIPKRIFFNYIGELKLSEERADAATKMFGDIMFNVPLDLTADFHARDAAYGKKIFLYEFHHLGQNSFLRAPNATYGQDWVSHADEVQYLFDVSAFYGESTEAEDLFMTEMMTALWFNFAKTGNPTPDLSLGFKWEPLSSSEIKFLILKSSPYMRGSIRDEEKLFLTNLPTTTNKLLFPERFVMDPEV